MSRVNVSRAVYISIFLPMITAVKQKGNSQSYDKETVMVYGNTIKDYLPINRRIVIFSTLLLFILCISKLYAGVGETSAEFLLISPGARPSSMAGTFTGIADDVHTLGYNPAGLGQIRQREISLMHGTWLVDTNYEFGAFAQPLSYGTLGFSLQYLDAGDMIGRGNMGQSTGNFTASDLAVTLGYGFPVMEEMYLGFTGKFINQKIDDAQRSGGAIDLGVLYEFIPDKFFTGAAIQNIGPKLEAFDKEEEALPTSYRIGVGYYAMEEKLLMASDIKSVIHGTPTWSAGFEYMIRTIFFLRSGISAGSEMDNALTWTGGVGFSIGSYYLDYSYEPFGELDSAHKISLVMKF